MGRQQKNQQYDISEDELKQIQAIQQELIREVARICLKCGIHFNMVGGTMLGAIRHKGYIPWDDDADIGFLRAEYEKFRKACKTELNHEKYYMQDLRDTKGYRWGYGKLRRKGTEFIRLIRNLCPMKRGYLIHFYRCFLYRKLF